MKQLYLLLFFTLTLSTAYSQKDFREGYIILKGDTIRGLVDYRGDPKSARVASFKSSPSGEIHTYTSEDISGYGFDKESKLFVSKLIPSSDSTGSVGQKVFLSILARGRVTLYYYRDTYRENHYYLEKDTLLAELVETTYRKTDPATGRTFVGTNKQYTAVLNTVLSDCQSLTTDQINSVILAHRSLIHIINKYNECLGGNSRSYQHQKEKAKVTLGPVLLYSQAELIFKDEPVLTQMHFQNKKLMGGGLSINLVLPELSEKLSLQANLLYIPYKYSDTYTTTGEFSYRHDVALDLAYLKLPLQVRYTYPKGKFRPFINTGFMVGVAVKADYTNWATSVRDENFRHKYSPIAFRDLTQGLTAGAGLATTLNGHTLSLEARIERNNGITVPTQLTTTMHNFNILLSYGF
ncbi:outer membrane protein with beta-barrel domain [Pontibacter mucosus]|uniref:Outer membrane protein with beta-barrel domain n=1 Tax=Pontibacter mucosus TaxID=1649266 RepID=A0A2T5Y3J0_9BACT|nr:outer membrane beta-barrel protein [Pontibacter mucosus]PTX10710.1 outer membrane protein with beta-barrel domain [Pontibacter mucosus]